MENDAKAISSASPSKKTGLIILVALLFAVLLCCFIVVVGILLFRTSRNTQTNHTSSAPITPATTYLLDAQAEPQFGSFNLQRGSSPDLYSVEIKAGGNADTSDNNLECGFTTTAPMFNFRLSGGASETFLRLYFSPSDNTDTTMIVYTPDNQWICMDDNSLTGGVDPVIDFDYAALGQYSIWVGTKVKDTFVPGKLFISQSQNNTP